MSTIKEVFVRKSSGFGPQTEIMDVGNLPLGLHAQKLTLISPTSGGRSRTKATEL
jgi:hypothetical protein